MSKQQLKVLAMRCICMSERAGRNEWWWWEWRSHETTKMKCIFYTYIFEMHLATTNSTSFFVHENVFAVVVDDATLLLLLLLRACFSYSVLLKLGCAQLLWKWLKYSSLKQLRRTIYLTLNIREVTPSWALKHCSNRNWMSASARAQKKTTRCECKLNHAGKKHRI